MPSYRASFSVYVWNNSIAIVLLITSNEQMSETKLFYRDCCSCSIRITEVLSHQCRIITSQLNRVNEAKCPNDTVLSEVWADLSIY